MIDYTAIERFLAALQQAGIAFELRQHEPPRHARHLAALWQAELQQAARATLLAADDQRVLAVVPADRKISAPRLRALLGARELRVLRGDRGVGRMGWDGLPGPPGALPALPALFGARAVVEPLILQSPRLILALEPGRSIALVSDDYARAIQAQMASFSGRTRLPNNRPPSRP